MIRNSLDYRVENLLRLNFCAYNFFLVQRWRLFWLVLVMIHIRCVHHDEKRKFIVSLKLIITLNKMSSLSWRQTNMIVTHFVTCIFLNFVSFFLLHYKHDFVYPKTSKSCKRNETTRSNRIIYLAIFLSFSLHFLLSYRQTATR